MLICFLWGFPPYNGAVFVQKKHAEMRSAPKSNKRSKKSRGQDEDMDVEVEEDLASIQATEALVLERAVRSTPFSDSVWAARILTAVSQYTL